MNVYRHIGFYRKILINFMGIYDLKSIMYFSELEDSPFPLLWVNEVIGRITPPPLHVETGSKLLLTFKGSVSERMGIRLSSDQMKG